LVQTPKATMPGNLSSFYQIRDAAGYDSLLHVDTVRLLDETNGTASAPPENGNMMFLRSSATPASLAELGVTKVFSPDPNWAGLAGEKVGENLYQFSIPGPGRFGDGIKILRDTPGKIEFQTESGGEITIRERGMEGWQATINGQSVTPNLGRWIQLENVPAGATVGLSYHAPGAGKGALIGLASLIALILSQALKIPRS
jgi:hypothetical protein